MQFFWQYHKLLSSQGSKGRIQSTEWGSPWQTFRTFYCQPATIHTTHFKIRCQILPVAVQILYSSQTEKQRRPSTARGSGNTDRLKQVRKCLQEIKCIHFVIFLMGHPASSCWSVQSKHQKKGCSFLFPSEKKLASRLKLRSHSFAQNHLVSLWKGMTPVLWGSKASVITSDPRWLTLACIPGGLDLTSTLSLHTHPCSHTYAPTHSYARN